MFTARTDSLPKGVIDSLRLRARLPRPAALSLWGAMLLSLALAACNNNQSSTSSYCDQTGCYTCNGNQCYPTSGDALAPSPNSSTSCADDSSCPSGQVCNLGFCQSSCTLDSQCQSGDVCISGRCRINGSASCGTAGAFCSATTSCGTNRSCVSGSCASACAATSDCALGQVCTNGSCVNDPAPQTAQCNFNYDCAAGQGGYTCINAYCMKNCAADTDCSGGASCIKSVCRADPRATS